MRISGYVDGGIDSKDSMMIESVSGIGWFGFQVLEFELGFGVWMVESGNGGDMVEAGILNVFRGGKWYG